MAETSEGPGSELRTARESMGVNIREVADAMNLPTHVIEALETDDYDRLPPSVFTRGYLRSYARLLEVPPEPLLARYPEVTEEMDAVTGELPSVSIPARPSLPMLLGAGAAVILIVLFLVWWFADDDEAVPTSAPVVDPAETRNLPPATRPDPAAAGEGIAEAAESEAITEPEETEADVVQASEAVETEARETPVLSAPETVSEPVAAPERVEQMPVRIEPETAPVETVPVETAEPAVVRTAVPGRQERRITEFGDDVAIFEFSEDCWVEVKSLDGENLYSDLNRAGRTLVLTGRAPFRVLLGYAPGVSLRFNDEPVPLERYSRNNVANLVLGER